MDVGDKSEAAGDSATCSFLPGMYRWEHWEKITYGEYLLAYRADNFSFLDTSGNTNDILGLL